MVIVVVVIIVVVVVIVVVVIIMIIVVIVVVIVVVVIVVIIVVIIVIVVVVIVRMSAGTLRRPVVVTVDPTAELHANAPEVQLFVGEGREGRQVGPGRQRLDARRLEVPYLRPGAESPR